MAKAAMRQASADHAESPSETIVGGASEMKYRTDARGRKIGVVKPTALLRYRLMKILGPESSRNEVLMGNAMLAFLVRSIDGEQIVVPNSERQLEVMIGRLDDDGLFAVGTCLIDDFGVSAPEDVGEVAKN